MTTVQDAILTAVNHFVAAGISDPWINAGYLMCALLDSQGMAKPHQSAASVEEQDKVRYEGASDRWISWAVQREALVPELKQFSDRKLSSRELDTFRYWISQREARVPAQYIVGYQLFCGLRMRVSPQVFIPRPYTEYFIDEVLDRLATRQEPKLTVAEIGTGSGAGAIAIEANEPRAELFATEPSGAALAIATVNAHEHGAARRITFLQGSGVAPLVEAGLQQEVTALIANPPDLTPEEVQELEKTVPEIGYEPIEALTAGEQDVLAVHKAIVNDANKILERNGFLALHVRPQRAEALAGILKDAGFYVEAIPGRKSYVPTTIIGTYKPKTSN